MVVMSPKDENELQHMVYTGLQHQGPIALRYPRGKALGVKLDKEFKKIPIGQAEVLSTGPDVAILAIGNMVEPAVGAAVLLAEAKIKATVVNARFAKPLDEKLFKKLAADGLPIVTVEENVCSGGFGGAVAELLAAEKTRIKTIGLPDEFIEQGACGILREKYNLTAEGIAQVTKSFLKG
jgi:1-deoxy-D-xylulose-5-phosphate synthase